MGLKQAIYDKRISYYKHDHFIKELVHLERDLDTKTVDHPEKFSDGEKGSKDISDCVAAVVMACLTLPEAGDSTGMVPPPPPPAASDSIIHSQKGTPQVDAAREQLRRMRRNG